MPANFVIPFPFIPEVLKDLIVQGSVCFKGRLFSTIKPRRLCSPLPVGNCIVRKFGAYSSGGSLPRTHLLSVAWVEMLPGAFCQLGSRGRVGGSHNISNGCREVRQRGSAPSSSIPPRAKCFQPWRERGTESKPSRKGQKSGKFGLALI